jgi:hypothetical protein
LEVGLTGCCSTDRTSVQTQQRIFLTTGIELLTKSTRYCIAPIPAGSMSRFLMLENSAKTVWSTFAQHGDFDPKGCTFDLLVTN